MIKKVRKISLLLVAIMTLSTSLVYGVSPIRVRIEGLKDTLFNRTVTITDEEYGIDVLKKAIGEKNIEGAGFITGLMGEDGNWPAPYWALYTVKDGLTTSSLVGIDTLAITDIGEELLFHRTEASWPSLTENSQVEITQEGLDYTLQVTTNNGAIAIPGVDVHVSYLGNFVTDTAGQVHFTLTEEGIYDIQISKDGAYPEIIRKHERIVLGDTSLAIKSTIDGLLGYYDTYGQYTFRQATGLNFASDNAEYLKKIHRKFISKDNSSATNAASNIIGLIASGYDPKNYNGINVVQTLIEKQDTEGKFLIGPYDDYPTSLAYAILALDMAGAEYNKESAVHAMLGYQNSDGSFGAFPDVDTTAMSLMALGRHREKEGVITAVDKGLAYMKTKQLDTGGFSPGYSDWNTGLEVTSENPYTICTVIQALIAHNINPFSDAWMKNGHHMVDALLAYQSGNHFEYNSEITMITEQVLGALADIYRGRSMYHNITPCFIEEEEEFGLSRIGTGSLTKGTEGKVTVALQNHTTSSKEATIIMGLYDLDANRMIYYNYFTKEYDAMEIEEITNAFFIPSTGNYSVKAFVWDNLDDMNIKAVPLTITVE